MRLETPSLFCQVERFQGGLSHSRGPSIFFWFRNKFPAIVVCFVKEDFLNFTSDLVLSVIINGHEHQHKPLFGGFFFESPCTALFHLQMKDNLDEALLENEWNLAEIVYGDLCDENGIHVLKKQSSVDDIRFIDPCRKRKLNDDLISS